MPAAISGCGAYGLQNIVMTPGDGSRKVKILCQSGGDGGGKCAACSMSMDGFYARILKGLYRAGYAHQQINHHRTIAMASFQENSFAAQVLEASVQVLRRQPQNFPAGWREPPPQADLE